MTTVTVPEAAYLLGRSINYVRKMIRRGELKGGTVRSPIKRRESWWVDTDAVYELARRQQGEG